MIAAARRRAGAAAALLRGERERRIAMAALGSLAAKLIAILTLLVSVPWTLGYLGAERYGMWVTLSSFSAMLSVADLGVGNGLMTALARASGRDDPGEVRRVVSNGLAAMFAVATLGGLIFAGIVALADWQAVFNVTSPLARAEALPAVIVFGACMFAGIPASIGTRLFMGLQRGVEGGLWTCAGSLLALVAVLVAIKLSLSLPALVFCFMGVPLLVGLIATVSVLLREGGVLLPRLSDVRLHDTLVLCRAGMLFLSLQLVSSLTYTTDNIVIAQVLGAKAVAGYSVADRLFGLIAVVMMMLNGPLWPAYAEASSRGDAGWIRATFRRSLWMNLALPALAGVFLLLFGRWIITLWVGGAVMPSLLLLIALTGRRIVEACASACSMLLNGLHVVIFQVGWGIAMAAAAIGLRVVLVRAMGPPGAAVGVGIAVLLFGLLPNLIFIPRLLARLDRPAVS